MSGLAYLLLCGIVAIQLVAAGSTDASARVSTAFPAIVTGYNANITLIGSNLPLYSDEWNSSFIVTCPEQPAPFRAPFRCSSKASFIEPQTTDKFICLIDRDISQYDGCTASLTLNSSKSALPFELAAVPILSSVVIAPISSQSIPYFEESSVSIIIPTLSGVPPSCRRASFFVQLQAAFWDTPDGPFIDLAVCFAKPRACDGPYEGDLVCEVHIDLTQFYPLYRALRVHAIVTRDRLLTTIPFGYHNNRIANFVPARPTVLPSSVISLNSASAPVVSLRMRSINLPSALQNYRFSFTSVTRHVCPLVAPLVGGPVFEGDVLLAVFNFTSMTHQLHGCNLSLRVELSGLYWSEVARFYRAPLLVGAMSDPQIDGALVPPSSDDTSKEPGFRTAVYVNGQFFGGYEPSPSSVRLQVRPAGPWSWCRTNSFVSSFKATNISITGTWARFDVALGSAFYGCSIIGYVSVPGSISETSVSLGRLAVTTQDIPSLRFLLTLRCAQCGSNFGMSPDETHLRSIRSWVAGIFLPGVNDSSVRTTFLSAGKGSDAVMWLFRLDLQDDAATDACNVRLQQQNSQKPLKESVPTLAIDGHIWSVEQANFACVLQSFSGIHTEDSNGTGMSSTSITILIIFCAGVVVLFASFSFGVLLCRLRESASLSFFNVNENGRALEGEDAQELDPIPTTIFSDSIEGVSPEETEKRITEECSICLEERSNAHAHPCGHWFCENCVERIRTCALCRAPIERISVIQLTPKKIEEDDALLEEIPNLIDKREQIDRPKETVDWAENVAISMADSGESSFDHEDTKETSSLLGSP